MHMQRRADAPTRPLPDAGRRSLRRPLGNLAAVTAAFWAAGAALFAGQDTGVAHSAPPGVRGAVWVIACGCLLAGLGCLAYCAAIAAEHAMRATAAARRRALDEAAPLGLAAGRERYRLIAEQAAGMEGAQQEAPALRVVGSDRRNGSHAQYGA
jgi:hypothetical protein